MAPNEVNGRNGNGIPRDPRALLVWALTGFLALVGLLFGVFNGVPWASKEAVALLQRDVARLEKRDDGHEQGLGAQALSFQAIQYEMRQLREHVEWLEAEVERIKTYVYPQPSGRAPRPKPPNMAPPIPRNVPGPPQTKYP